MRSLRRLLFALAVITTLAATLAIPADAQSVITTVPVGSNPVNIWANPTTNNIYALNAGSNTVTVIDGATNTVTATVPTGGSPSGIAINQVTNKIYVTNKTGNSVTVIDGVTNNPVTVPVGTSPGGIDVNPLTNKVYVSNGGGNTVTVIDGATLATHTVTVGNDPLFLQANPVTNKIYVPNFNDGTVTVIDGATLATHTVPVAASPAILLINTVTNKIYVGCYSTHSSVYEIDGANLSTSHVPITSLGAMSLDPVTNKVYVTSGNNAVIAIDGTTLATTTIPVTSTGDVEVDPATNKIYSGNGSSNTVTVIDGATLSTTIIPVTDPGEGIVNPVTNRIYFTDATDSIVTVIAGAPSSALQFVPMPPCRVIDTRHGQGIFGPPAIPGGTARIFPLPQSNVCNIPSTAAAYSLNVTVVPHGFLGFLTIWPTGLLQPVTSTMNSTDGRVKANAAIVPAGANGAVSIFVQDTTDVVVDINGYFVPAGTSAALAFYPLTPCRIFDTRHGDGPSLEALTSRNVDVLGNTHSCSIPNTAQAYSLNFTSIPKGGFLGFLTVYPAGESLPTVSTLNAPTGAVTANAGIVPAGSSGEISVYPQNASDLAIDINGYFAPPAMDGEAFYPLPPCRVLDTRHTNGAFSGELNPPVNVVGSPCAVPSTAQAFVFNATVVPPSFLGFLTLWPDGESQPVVSTLNAADGFITSNMAIVPTTNGLIDAFANGTTQLLLDISGYFAEIPALSITTTGLPSAVLAVEYNATLTAIHGTPPYTWRVSSGNLPDGLTLDGTTGIISGIPTTLENPTFTVEAEDSASTPETATAQLIITVNGSIAGNLHTSGSQILNASGQRVHIASVNWYGLETADQAPGGLWAQDYHSILNTVQSLGYNVIRLAFSNQMVESPIVPTNISFSNSTGPINTDLQGLNSLQIMDKLIKYAGQIGLRIILDNERSEAGFGDESSGLWYTDAYPERSWINDWVTLTQRYLSSPAILGMDLRDDPHNGASGGSCWGCGTVRNDWRLAAERAGNAILNVNPNLLIVVEGTDYYNGDYYWYGGNLEGAQDFPVALRVANQLVYSSHDYGPDAFLQSWFNSTTSYSSMLTVWTKYWAYLSLNGIAPVWVGKISTTNYTSDIESSVPGSQGQWFSLIVAFFQNNPTIGWSYDQLGSAGVNYGLLDANYDPPPVNFLKQQFLSSIQ